MIMQSVWGWEPALYLFLGGLGAGTFVVSAFTFLITKAHCKALSIASWSAVGCLIVGLLLLLADVVKPFQAMLLWQSFVNIESSWMAIGAWLLAAAVVVFALFAFANTEKLSGRLGIKTRRVIAVIAGILGIALGLSVAAYTGILLKSASGVPFWNCGFLPALFTVSAVDTGTALLAIIMALKDKEAHIVRRNLEIVTIVLVIIEAIVLGIYLYVMGNGGNEITAFFNAGAEKAALASVTALISGDFAFWFWGGVVALGLALPLVLAFVGLKIGKTTKEQTKTQIAIIGGVGALVGGCILRFVVLLSGAHADILINWAAELL